MVFFARTLASMVDLVELDVPGDPRERRLIAIAQALASEDWSAAGPTRGELAALLGPPPAGLAWDLARPFHVDPATGAETGVSTCALVARGWLYRAGVAIPSYEHPYRPGKMTNAMVELEAIARAAGAWHSANDGQPSAGDTFATLDYGGHTGMVIGRDGDTLTTIEGGQAEPGDGYLQSIRRRVRRWPQTARHGWADVARLPFRSTCVVPAAFMPHAPGPGGGWIVAATLAAIVLMRVLGKKRPG
jgi:hypothetical protein